MRSQSRLTRHLQKNRLRSEDLRRCYGGQGGIRTLDRVTPIYAFQAYAFSRSATCPGEYERVGMMEGLVPGSIAQEAPPRGAAKPSQGWVQCSRSTPGGGTWSLKTPALLGAGVGNWWSPKAASS